MRADMKSRFVGLYNLQASIPVIMTSFIPLTSSMPCHSEQLNGHLKTPEKWSTKPCMSMKWLGVKEGDETQILILKIFFSYHWFSSQCKASTGMSRLNLQRKLIHQRWIQIFFKKGMAARAVGKIITKSEPLLCCRVPSCHPQILLLAHCWFWSITHP